MSGFIRHWNRSPAAGSGAAPIVLRLDAPGIVSIERPRASGLSALHGACSSGIVAGLFAYLGCVVGFRGLRFGPAHDGVRSSPMVSWPEGGSDPYRMFLLNIVDAHTVAVVLGPRSCNY
ncbi:MAG: hypothetical protein HY308_09050 [Gammaproteobacteria bacterium]|nr:hypothetical protein [Gammaproteobacteria bacterium]